MLLQGLRSGSPPLFECPQKTDQISPFGGFSSRSSQGVVPEAGLRTSKPIKRFLWSRESPDVILLVRSETPPGETPLDVPVLLSYISSDITFVAT